MNPVSNEFDGKVVLVTGADGGIGSEIAAQFIAAGARVALAGIDQSRGEAVVQKLGAQAEWVTLDVSNEAQWQAAIQGIEARHGRLDVLVNNAGYLTSGGSIEDTTLENWQKHFAINTEGPFLGCKHAVLSMKKTGGGAIVNLSSAVAVRLHSFSPAYGVSKSSVLALTRVAALHCNQQHYNIRVNAVLPGPIDTPMMRGAMAEEEFQRVEQFLINKYALPRIGVPADIARTVLFLASPKSEYITGAAFTVDGGQSA